MVKDDIEKEILSDKVTIHAPMGVIMYSKPFSVAKDKVEFRLYPYEHLFSMLIHAQI